MKCDAAFVERAGCLLVGRQQISLEDIHRLQDFLERLGLGD